MVDHPSGRPVPLTPSPRSPHLLYIQDKAKDSLASRRSCCPATAILPKVLKDLGGAGARKSQPALEIREYGKRGFSREEISTDADRRVKLCFSGVQNFFF